MTRNKASRGERSLPAEPVWKGCFGSWLPMHNFRPSFSKQASFKMSEHLRVCIMQMTAVVACHLMHSPCQSFNLLLQFPVKSYNKYGFAPHWLLCPWNRASYKLTSQSSSYKADGKATWRGFETGTHRLGNELNKSIRGTSKSCKWGYEYPRKIYFLKKTQKDLQDALMTSQVKCTILRELVAKWACVD